MKKHLFIKLSLLLLLVICNTHAWGKYLYLSTANFIDWEKDGATFKLYPGTGSDIVGTKIYDHMFRFDVTAVSTAANAMYFKRMSKDGSTKWNEFKVTYSASYNTYKATGYSAGSCANSNLTEIYLDVHNEWYKDGPIFKLTTGGTTYTAAGFAGTNLVIFSVPSPSGTLQFERWSSDNKTKWNQLSTTYTSSYNAYEVASNYASVSASYNVKIVEKANYIYFDNSQTNWSTSKKYVVMGHDKPTAYSSTYLFTTTPISNTKLWYYSNTTVTWRDATYFAFLGSGSNFNEGSWGSSNLSTASKYTAAYTDMTNLEWGKLYLFKPASGDNGAALSLQTATAASGLNITQTVQYALSIDGGTTYSDMSSGKTPGQISISAYKFSDGTYNSVSNSSNSQTISGGTTGTYSASVPAACTGNTTYSYTSTQTGYSFVGWYDGSTRISTNNSFTANPNTAKTITARYKATQVTVTLNGNSGTGNTASVTATYGVSTLPSITNPTRDGYVFAGWFTGTGGTGKLVIDIDGSLQPGISSYTDADGNWLKTSNVTLYAAWLTVHTPGTYTSTYGQPLTISSCEAYEVYRYAVSSNTIYFNAGGESAPITSSDPRNLFSFSKNNSAGACSITWNGWVGHTEVYDKGTGTTTASGEFKAHSVCQPTCRDQQGVIMCVSGYSQFSIYAQDADNTGKKHFKVFINGVEQAMTLNKGFTVRRFDLTPANTYVIRVTGQTDNNNLIQGISLKVPNYPDPSALAASEITSAGATLTVTDVCNSNNYEFYISESDTPPTSESTPTHSVTSGKVKVVDDLDPSTTYYAWARAYCSSTKSDWVALTGSYFTTSAAGCSATAPGTISKGTLSGCSITLTASGSAASNNTWYWQASADGTSTSESGATKTVDEAGTYYLRSYYSTGNCWSDAVSFEVTDSHLTPAAPSALAAASPTAKGVTLTVTDAANTNDYEFYVSTDDDEPGAGTSATHSVTSGKSLTITDLYAGTTFYAWARAKCGSNKSAWTALTDDSFETSTVSVTHTLTNVSKTNGATSGVGGSDYEAVYEADEDYSLPTPVVTIGGNTATSGTDYTWTAGTGTISIPANKINGNIVITLNSAAAAPSSVAISGGLLYFAGETISLTATPTGGNGPVTYQWYKGGKENGNAIEGATNATYTKASCAFGDAGSYYCKVTCGGSQSTWGQSGNAYDVKIPRLYVKTGHNNDPVKPDYGNVDFTRATASTATASIVLGSNGDYCFNIADGCGHYYGNSGTMQYNNTGWITNVSPQDCGLTTTNAGTYIFTINYSNWSQLTTTITFPSCTDPGLAFASASKSVTLCDDAPTNALTNTHGVTVSYASSDETVATVASDGTLTIKKAGTTTITASSLEQTVSAVTYCADNASYTLTVNASTAAGLAYGTAAMEKNVGDANFTNTLTNSHSLDVTYESSNTSVATVAANGEVTIKAAGTTTITAHSAQQKKSTTCYAAGSATYTLTVYPVYTVTYNAMGGTCSPTSTNTTTALGKVTLPSATHAIYTTYTWVTSDGTEAGDAGDTYTPEGNINLYAKWSGSCAGGGSTTVVIFDGSTMSSKTSASGTSYERDTEHTHAGTGLKYTLNGVKDWLVSASLTGGSPSKTYTNSIQNGGGGSASYHIELKVPTGKTATVYVAYWTGSTNHYIGLNASSAISPTGSNCTWNPDKAASTNTIYYGTTSSLSAGTYYLVGDADAIRFAEVKVTVTGSTCYTVTYDGNGADGGYTNDPTAYDNENNDVEVLPNGYTRTGYEFIGWNTANDGSGTPYAPLETISDIDDDVTLYAQWKQINYFTNDASTGYWNNTGNWSMGSLPKIDDPVVIREDVTVDINNAKALRVDIETGKTLTINAGMALIIAETLTKNGGATEAADVIINSTRDAGVGALIIGSEAGDNAATMNFETKAKLVGGSTVNQFIGSPFSNAAPYVDYGQQLYKFCPKQNGDRGWWQSHTSLATMTPFWGYNVLCTETSFLDLNWTGKLNPSESKTITDFYYNGSSETDNMFANSWTAPIHVGAFEDGDFVNASTTLYMFNAGTPAQEAGHSDDDATNGSTEPGTYISIPIHSAPYAGIGVIPSMQAFYVLSTGSDASITLDYNKIVYTPALTSVGIVPNRAPKHNAEVVEPEVIKLHVQSETGWAANTYVMGRADFAEGYEDGWDGAYIEGESATPKLYTPSIDGNMFINCLPEIEGTVVGFRKGSSDNNYIFSFDYDGDEVWYLNDQKAQKSTQIMNGQTYAFVSEAGDNAARFVISATPINKIATGCESVGAEAAKVRKLIINDKVYIIRGGQVFDVLGKTIKK